jgi:hypothetical protein
MGAPINYVFQDGSDEAVVLYSHWGADAWEWDLGAALKHSERRWGDTTYAVRMVISHFIKDELMDDAGFGIFALNVKTDLHMLDGDTVFVDFKKRIVQANWDGDDEVEFADFIANWDWNGANNE